MNSWAKNRIIDLSKIDIDVTFYTNAHAYACKLRIPQLTPHSVGISSRWKRSASIDMILDQVWMWLWRHQSAWLNTVTTTVDNKKRVNSCVFSEGVQQQKHRQKKPKMLSLVRYYSNFDSQFSLLMEMFVKTISCLFAWDIGVILEIHKRATVVQIALLWIS